MYRLSVGMSTPVAYSKGQRLRSCIIRLRQCLKLKQIAFGRKLTSTLPILVLIRIQYMKTKRNTHMHTYRSLLIVALISIVTHISAVGVRQYVKTVYSVQIFRYKRERNY